MRHLRPSYGPTILTWAKVSKWVISHQTFNVIFNPLGLIITWLIYTVVAFLFARVLGGKGTLNQTLGCTALAVAPQMIGAVHLLPYAQTGWIGAWVLVCSYLGLKVSGRLTPWRAFWATILPFVLLALIVLLLGCIAIAALSSGGGSR